MKLNLLVAGKCLSAIQQTRSQADWERCHRSKLECCYRPPRAWLFDPSAASSSRPPGLLSDRAAPSRRSCSNRPSVFQDDQGLTPTVFTYPRTVLGSVAVNLYASEHEHDAFECWTLFLINHIEPRARFFSNSPDMWRT